MERGQVWRKDMKLETPTETDHRHHHHHLSSSGTKFQPTSPPGTGNPTLTRQPSATKNTCLCSPTNHAGSFRCRLHRAPNLQRTKSIDSGVKLDTNSGTDGGVAANVNAVEGH